MRKIILLILMVGFVAGTAGAEQLTFNFRAEIDSYSDYTGMFEALGYDSIGEFTGTFTIDTDANARVEPLDPFACYAYSWWDTGDVKLTNQGFGWTEAPNQTLVVYNMPVTSSTDPSAYRRTDVKQEQGGLADFPDVNYVSILISLKNEGWDASMPTDFNVGASGQLIFNIETKENSSLIEATITEIVSAEEEEEAGTGGVMTRDLEQTQEEIQFSSRKNETLYKRIKQALGKLDVNDGNPNNDHAACRELEVFERQYRKRADGFTESENEFFGSLFEQKPACDSEVAAKHKK